MSLHVIDTVVIVVVVVVVVVADAVDDVDAVVVVTAFVIAGSKPGFVLSRHFDRKLDKLTDSLFCRRCCQFKMQLFTLF